MNFKFTKDEIVIPANLLTNESKISVSVSKVISKDSSEWAVVENTHEPIITQELWNKCVELEKSCSRGKRTKEGVTLPLSGFCYCADCGHKMRQSGYPSAYICGRYAKSGQSVCSTHYIRVALLEKVILADLKSMLDLTVDEEKAKKIFLERKSGTRAAQIADDKKKIKVHENRLAELEKLIHSAYEDKVMGRVAENMALSLLSDYQREKEKLSSELGEIKHRLETQQKDSDDVDEFIRRLKMYANAEVLTREMVLRLIEYVTIDENPRSIKHMNERDILRNSSHKALHRAYKSLL